MRRTFSLVAAALTLGLALSGCGQDTPTRTAADKKDRMDMQDAAERADDMLDAVLGAIEPEVRWAHGPTTSGTCDVTRRRTVMTIVADGRRAAFLEQVEKFWRAQKYTIKAKNKDEVFPALYARSARGFGISVSFRGKGQAFFEVDSPCVKESKVAESTSKPNGPAYKGVYPLPRPNVRSDYWSGGAP